MEIVIKDEIKDVFNSVGVNDIASFIENEAIMMLLSKESKYRAEYNMFKDKYNARGFIYSSIGMAGILFEIIFRPPPEFLVILFYIAIIGIGFILIFFLKEQTWDSHKKTIHWEVYQNIIYQTSISLPNGKILPFQTN